MREASRPAALLCARLRWSDYGAEPEEGGDTDGRRGACLCPAVGEVCTKGRPGCHLHV